MKMRGVLSCPVAHSLAKEPVMTPQDTVPLTFPTIKPEYTGRQVS